MATVRSRRFTLLDAMLLVVAAAVGLALARLTLPDQRSIKTGFTVTTVVVNPPVSQSPAILIRLREMIGSVVRASATVYPSVMTFTIATLILRFRQPRPRFRLLFRQPGTVGCSSAVLALIVAISNLTPSTIHELGIPGFDRWMINVGLYTSRGAGMAVAGAWLTLALSGRWQAEASWVDRMGRVLGVAWIFALLLEAAAVWSSFFY